MSAVVVYGVCLQGQRMCWIFLWHAAAFLIKACARLIVVHRMHAFGFSMQAGRRRIHTAGFIGGFGVRAPALRMHASPTVMGFV